MDYADTLELARAAISNARDTNGVWHELATVTRKTIVGTEDYYGDNDEVTTTTLVIPLVLSITGPNRFVFQDGQVGQSGQDMNAVYKAIAPYDNPLLEGDEFTLASVGKSFVVDKVDNNAISSNAKLLPKA